MLQQMAHSLLLLKTQTQLLKAFVFERTNIFFVYPILLLATEIQENSTIGVQYYKQLSIFIISVFC